MIKVTETKENVLVFFLFCHTFSQIQKINLSTACLFLASNIGDAVVFLKMLLTMIPLGNAGGGKS